MTLRVYASRRLASLSVARIKVLKLLTSATHQNLLFDTGILEWLMVWA